jgi:hypothetical protein
MQKAGRPQPKIDGIGWISGARSAAGVEGEALDPTLLLQLRNRKNCSGAFPTFASNYISESEILRRLLVQYIAAACQLVVLRIELGYGNTRVRYRQLRVTIYVSSAQEGSDISLHQAESDGNWAESRPFWLSCVASAQAAAEMRTALPQESAD